MSQVLFCPFVIVSGCLVWLSLFPSHRSHLSVLKTPPPGALVHRALCAGGDATPEEDLQGGTKRSYQVISI